MESDERNSPNRVKGGLAKQECVVVLYSLGGRLRNGLQKTDKGIDRNIVNN